MLAKQPRKSVGIVLFVGFLLLASSREAYSHSGEASSFFTLTVTVLNAKATSCTGTQTSVSGAAVSLRLPSGVMNRVTDANGVAVFNSVPGGDNLGITASRTGCDRNTVVFSMPNQNAHSTIGLENCATNLNYDISARFLGSGTDTVRAGNNYTVSFVVKNNGANGPSRTRNVTLLRLFADGPGSPVGTAKKVLSLCVNEEVGFDVTDVPPVGVIGYTLRWDNNPDQGITNTNHQPTKTVTVRRF
jgi:hypothetical protein